MGYIMRELFDTPTDEETQTLLKASRERCISELPRPGLSCIDHSCMVGGQLSIDHIDPSRWCPGCRSVIGAKLYVRDDVEAAKMLVKHQKAKRWTDYQLGSIDNEERTTT